jgi:hypothetical protein
MARKFGLQDGTSYLPKYNWGIGMNDDVAYNDRSGYTTSVEMVTGGQAADWYCFGGLEVGNQYDLDPMGEERQKTTFEESDEGPEAMGHIGMLTTETAGMQPTEALVGDGKRVDISSPQNYTSGTSMKKV